MRILLTGANGFTGRHFKEIALKNNHEVIQLRSDLTDFSYLESELDNQEFDAVVHLAAISFVDHQKKNDFYNVNVVGTTNLLDVLVRRNEPLKSVLIASSANIYGNCESSPIKEEQSPAPVNHYAASKVVMELMAKNYINRLPLFFVRPFNYTGIGQDESFVIPKIISHFKRKSEKIELGNIQVEREFNDVRFVCNAYLKLLNDSKIGETYNICTNRPMSLLSVIDRVSDLTSHKLQISVNPAFVRANEIHRLSGDNTKLLSLVGDVNNYEIEDTLTWMLEQD